MFKIRVQGRSILDSWSAFSFSFSIYCAKKSSSPSTW